MIYTVTLSPSLDYKMIVENLKLGEVNRSVRQSLVPGGKGINVSLVLHTLCIQTKALGFLSGSIGNLILELLQSYDIKTDFVQTDGESRINVKLYGVNETAINGQGPIPSADDVENLYSRLGQAQKDDIVVFSGAIPNGFDMDIYAKAIAKLNAQGVTCVVDTSGPALLKAVASHPFLIKPNKEELEEVMMTKLSNECSMLNALDKLQDRGARNIIVSLGSEGAILYTEKKEVIRAKAPKVKVVSTVGSGDSLVAGFLSQYSIGKPLDYSLRYGVACGSATASLDGMATLSLTTKLLKEVK